MMANNHIISFIAVAIALSSCVHFRTEGHKEAYTLNKFMHYMEDHNFEIARNYIADCSKDNFDSFISDFTCDRDGNLPELSISIVRAETDNYFILNMSKVGESSKHFVFTGYFENRYVCFKSDSHGQGLIGSFLYEASKNQKVDLYDDEHGVCIASVDPSQEGINYILKYKGEKRSLVAMQTYNDGTYYKYYKNFWVDNKHVVTDAKHRVKHVMKKELPNSFLSMEGFAYHYYYYWIIFILWFFIVCAILICSHKAHDVEEALLPFGLLLIPLSSLGHIVRLFDGTLTSILYDFVHYVNVSAICISIAIVVAAIGVIVTNIIKKRKDVK